VFVQACGCEGNTPDYNQAIQHLISCQTLYLLRGFLIPIINTIFIRLSTTAYVFLFLSLSCPKTQPLVSLTQERPKLNRLHSPSPIYRKLKFPLRPATLWPTPCMVTCQCSDTSTPGSRCSRVDRNEKQLRRCGLNVLRPVDKVNLRMTRLSTEVRIRILSSVDQTYVA
jgi:hypothetical protein